MRPMGKPAQVLNETKTNNTTLQAVLGNIVNEQVDAIVNAANEHLAHGGGVAGAISNAAGRQMDSESSAYVRKNGKVKTGRVAVTGPGRIPIKWIIHAVGPIYRGRPKESDQLYSACFNTFAKAHELGLNSISIPAISSGIFGFPKDRCAVIMITSALDFCEQVRDTPLQLIRFANFDMPTADVFRKGIELLRNNKFERYHPNPQFLDAQGLGNLHKSHRIDEETKETQQEANNEESKEEIQPKPSQNMDIDEDRKTDQQPDQQHMNVDEENKEEVHTESSNNP